ncbi:ATP synthase F1 subunit epsilon [Prolixibacteraceae bacterium JC049]|nr:ATP synthase F1 subunit epsilon [Prolixibacteraceae bacterium JC049]
MYLEIITPEKKVYEGEIKLVKLPGSAGSFEILENHAPIVSTLDTGELKIVDTNDETTIYQIKGGVVEARQNKVVVLAESV